VVRDLGERLSDLGGEVFYLVCAVRDLGDRLAHPGGEALYLGGEAFYLICVVRDLGDRLSDPSGEVFYPIHAVCNPGNGLAARSADLAGNVRT